MKKALFVGVLCLAVSLGFFVTSCGPGDGEAKAGAQKTCPMMAGNPINKKIFVDHKGKRIYFCCADCKKGFKANADALMDKMTDAGVILEDTPK